MTISHRSTLALGVALAVAPAVNGSMHAQGTTTPTVHEACFVPATGTVYRIKQQGLLQACRAGHVAFSWTEDAGALRAGAAAGGDLAGTLPNAAVAGLRGRPIAEAAPTNGQVYTFDAASSAWVPKTPAAGATDHGAMSGLADDDHPQYLVANGVRTAVNGFAVAGGTSLGAIPASGPGVRMMWYPGMGAFRSGEAAGTEWDAANIGSHSFAAGYGTKASGRGAIAFAQQAEATGDESVAIGWRTKASGQGAYALGMGAVASNSGAVAIGSSAEATGSVSVAIGSGARARDIGAVAIGTVSSATGVNSIALGFSDTASGLRSVALGSAAVASGNYSVAIGHYINANLQSGAFLIGDGSTSTVMNASMMNQFSARFANGYRLFTNSLLTSGVSLAPGAGSWSSVSDVNRKLDFRAVDGEEILRKLAAMPVTTWQYRSQDASIRHIGPTAQDFHRAFGVGESDTTITGVDADGVALAAVKALEVRTRELQAENAALREELESLRKSVLELRDATRRDR